MFTTNFTPQEANQRLPLIKKIVADILEKGQALRALAETLDGNQAYPPEYEQLTKEISELIEELESLGCFFKDWNYEIGLVDFPSIIEKEQVFLCWRSDEEDVRWYHPIEAGYAGRRIIPEYLLKQRKEVKEEAHGI